MFFPSSQYRQRFYDLVKKLTEGEEGMMTNLDEDSIEDQIDVLYYSILIIPHVLDLYLPVFSLNTNWMIPRKKLFLVKEPMVLYMQLLILTHKYELQLRKYQKET